MSNAISQSATNLATSTPKEISFRAVVEKNSLRSVKGVTRERLLLNVSKLFTSCCDEVRSMLGLEKGVRLPAEMAARLQDEISDYVTKQINRVNPSNAIGFRRAFYHDSKNLRVTDRITAIGENILALKEQHLGANILLGEKNKRLDELMKKPSPDYDREAAVKEEIRKLEFTKTHIEACIAKMESEKKEVSNQ